MRDEKLDIAISVRKLNCAYGQRPVLRDVSFDVHRGEIFVIIGATGCGKTTLLKHMIGLYRPVSGSILYHIARLGQSRDMARADGPEKDGILRPPGGHVTGRGHVRVHDVLENVMLPWRISPTCRPRLGSSSPA
jgi:phospholipid/cholesterol/gamma-HCH transport system ATP-binding protein